MNNTISGKKIIFLDGDGTLWYPRSTKRSQVPHWIYRDPVLSNNALSHLILIPRVRETLEALKQKGLILVLISTHPHSKKEADRLLEEKVVYFRLGKYFEAVYTARHYPGGKGEVIARVLKQLRIPKSHAMMIGDSYRFDYRSARDLGIDALLIQSAYMKHPPRGPRIRKLIDGIEDLI